MPRRKKMRIKSKLAIIAVLVLAVIILLGWYLHQTTIPVLEPKGPVGDKERNLMVFTVTLGFLVIVPVFIMTIFIAWKYRETNTRAKYAPDFDRHRGAEFTWWAIPIVIISILAVVTWTSTYALDPFKPLASNKKQLTIQVIALDWKWLFIYPNQNIASVNLVQFPVNTPVDFQITSDTVMNSFWVPQLGGQIYAMPGMATELHLMANQDGSFNGSSANISGMGFAGMAFVAKASSEQDFDNWVAKAKKASNPLTLAAYTKLAKSSEYNPVTYYSQTAKGLFDTEIDKYIVPKSPKSSSSNGKSEQTNTTPSMEGMYMP